MYSKSAGCIRWVDAEGRRYAANDEDARDTGAELRERFAEWQAGLYTLHQSRTKVPRLIDFFRERGWSHGITSSRRGNPGHGLLMAWPGSQR
jgi:hypothetical protein